MSDLMIPRWKVVLDYPASEFEIGEIIELNDTRQGKPAHTFTKENNFSIWLVEHLDKYPHIFKSLKWWEFRNVKVFKKLLKTMEYIKTKSGEVRKIDKYNFTGDDVKDWWFVTGRWVVGIEHCEPATPSEYETYKSI